MEGKRFWDLLRLKLLAFVLLFDSSLQFSVSKTRSGQLARAKHTLTHTQLALTCFMTLGIHKEPKQIIAEMIPCNRFPSSRLKQSAKNSIGYAGGHPL